MSATGALTTKMFVSPLRPSARTQAGYEALDIRTITPSDLSSNVFTIPEADYVTVVSGDPTTISADIAPLVTGTTYYIIKLGSNTISLANTPEEARSETAIVITASLTSQTLEVSNWKALGELTNVDEFGRQYEVVRANNLSDGATRKAKGSYDNGSVPFELLFDARDGGQVIMEEGLLTTLNYAFRIDVPPDTDGGDGPTYYLQALITSFRPRIGGPNDMTMMRGNLEIDHNDPVVVPG